MTTIAEIVHMASLPPQAARAYLRECNMTSDERECHLYATGRTAEAALIKLEIDRNDAAVEELEQERDEHKELADKYYKENEDLQAAVEAAEEKVLTLTSELENAQDEAKALRDEAKALHAEIREKSLDLL